MDSNSTWLCRLCLQQSDDVVNIFDDFQNSTIASILTQHFWFQANKDGLSDCLCQICWINTKTFHIFFKAVELLQKDYWDSVKSIETGLIKQERCGSPIDTELELELDIVKSEVTEPTNQVFIPDISEEKSFNYSDDFSCNQSEIATTTSKDLYKDQYLTAKRTTNRSKKEGEKKLKSKEKQGSDESQRKKDYEDAQIRECFSMTCEICGDHFETLRNAQKHYRIVHKRRGYLTCCGRKFSERKRVIGHINYHLNPDAFSCDKCGKKFTNRTSLKYHIESHEPFSSRPFKCDLCPKSFSREYVLASHKQFVHCSVKCVECDITYPSRSKLTTHIKNVHQPKVNTTRVCDICSKDFANKYSLLIHMEAMHSTIENSKFQCDICGARSKNKRYLAKHMSLHRQDSAKCSICNKVLQNKYSLASHIRYVHTEKRHRCTICEKKFRTRLSLKEHIAGHTGQDLYECAYCPKTFNSSGNMYSHRKKMHLAEWTQDCTKRRAILEKISTTAT